MKSNLILKKFETENVPGTMNVRDLRTFFGGKIVYTEDIISINDDAIEFSYVGSGRELGYQYYNKDNMPEDWEVNYIENLTDLKNNNHTISVLSQPTQNLNINTRWKIEIDAKSILRDYLFFKFRESRAFQVINYSELYNKSINNSIYNYIDWNVIDTYKFETLNFYVSYSNIKKEQSIKKVILLQYQSNFTEDVYDAKNKISNFNLLIDEYNFEKIIMLYYQTKSSQQYKFDYYFDLKFIKT